MNRRWAFYLSLAAFLLATIYVLAAPAPSLPIAVANGVYTNDCCGSVRLSDGTMSFQGGSITYKVERDKVGAYILPEALVAVEPHHGLQVEKQSHPLMLRLDDEAHPESFTIVGSDNVKYRFTRQ